MAKEIVLTKGYVALVDDEDFERVSLFKWHVLLPSAKSGGKTPYAQTKVNGSKQTLHRFVMGLTGDLEVDHRDRNGLNCQKSNLRVSTGSLNCANRRARKHTSGFKGVYRVRNKFQASVRVQGRNRSQGYFTDVTAAAKAYDAAAREYFGEFAVLNFAEKAA